MNWAISHRFHLPTMHFFPLVCLKWDFIVKNCYLPIPTIIGNQSAWLDRPIFLHYSVAQPTYWLVHEVQYDTFTSIHNHITGLPSDIYKMESTAFRTGLQWAILSNSWGILCNLNPIHTICNIWYINHILSRWFTIYSTSISIYLYTHCTRTSTYTYIYVPV